MDQAKPAAVAKSSAADAAAFWGLPAPAFSPEQLARLKTACALLNCGANSEVAHIAIGEAAPRAARLHQGADALPAPYGFLGFARLKRTNDYPYYSSSYSYSHSAHNSPSPKWFDFSAPFDHLGFHALVNRRGNATKALLLEGCHPALMFTRRWDGSDLPGPAAVSRMLVEAAPRASIDACKAVFNALDAAAQDKAAFRAAFADAARAALARVWLAREGVANRSEWTAVVECCFAVEALAKKKALPDDLAKAAPSLAAKRASFKEPAEGAGFEFSDEQKIRMRAIAVLIESDDLRGFAALAPLAGLDSAEAFAAGVPSGAGFDWPQGKYWTSKLASRGAHLCGAHALDAGDNPWLCAGDAEIGAKAQGNPFTWLALNSSENEGFGAFAMSFARAALRDAETREPGRGLAFCLEAFEQSRKGARKAWSLAGASAALGACEATLLPSMIASESPGDAQAGAEPVREPSARRARL